MVFGQRATQPVGLARPYHKSAANRFSPEPTAAVELGQQNWEEMWNSLIGVAVPRDVDPKRDRTAMTSGGFTSGTLNRSCGWAMRLRTAFAFNRSHDDSQGSSRDGEPDRATQSTRTHV